jgi:hypothetical protein
MSTRYIKFTNSYRLTNCAFFKALLTNHCDILTKNRVLLLLMPMVLFLRKKIPVNQLLIKIYSSKISRQLREKPTFAVDRRLTSLVLIPRPRPSVCVRHLRNRCIDITDLILYKQAGSHGYTIT